MEYTDEIKIEKWGSIANYNIAQAQRYLDDTDYIIIKMIEYEKEGKDITEDYSEILKKREEARQTIRDNRD